MMTFLFDNEYGESRCGDFTDWEAAEQFADRWGWQLIGEYVGEQPGPLWLLDTPEGFQ